MDAANVGVSLWLGKSDVLELIHIIGVVSFAVGSFLETGSEIQRAIFKRNPKNSGKLHTSGLFSFAQHINYTGYMVTTNKSPIHLDLIQSSVLEGRILTCFGICLGAASSILSFGHLCHPLDSESAALS